jgi:aquaporin NIP
MPSLTFARKVVAEIIGTFFMIFAGCGSVIIDKKTDGSITHLGVSLVWGMVVMILIYTIGHISGAHLNPSVTLAFAVVRRFPWTQVPAYIGAQVFASISAGFVLRLMFGEVAHMAATVPAGSTMQSFVLEIIVTFFLMFVVSAVATDTRAIGELAGLAVGTTVAMNVIVAGPISGSSMNPARTIGSAVSGNKYTSIWIYMVAPVVGAIMGAMSYNMIRLTDKPVREISKSGSFLKSQHSSR